MELYICNAVIDGDMRRGGGWGAGGGWGGGECPNCRPQWGLGGEMSNQKYFFYGMVGIGTEIHIYLKTSLFCCLDTYISIYFFVI